MDEEIAIINSNTRVEKTKIFISNNPEIEAMVVYVDSQNEINTFYSQGFEELIFD